MMGRAPCCDKAKVKRGPWSPEEDTTLKNYIHKNGTAGNWIALPHKAGLKRCGKSCRLRWLNYLRPDIKHGGFTEEEDNTILTLYTNIGSRWSVIASHMPGRTDNDVKNHWNTKLKKKALFAGKSLNNCNIIPTKNNSMQYFSSTKLVPKSENQYYGNSYFPPMNSSTFPYPVDMNYHQIQFPPPKLTQLQQNYATSSSAYCNSFTTVPLSQEISIVSPSFSLESSNYALRSGDGGGEDDEFLMELGYADLLNGFNFHEKNSEFGGHVANFTYSSLLPNNISDIDPSQGFYPKVAN